MGLENEFLKIGGVKLESTQATEAKDSGMYVKEESEYCPRCLILDARCKKAEERCAVLESEIEKRMSDIQVLQRQMKGPDERIIQTANGDKATTVEEGEKCVIDLTEDVENDKVMELMIENKVLDCEKRKAESEVGFWKAKCKDLELRITSLESKLSSTFEERLSAGMTDVGLASPGSYKKPIIKTEAMQEECYGVTTPLIDPTLLGNARQVNGASSEIIHEKEQGCSSRTRKQLNFGEGTPDKMAPATPAGGLLPAVAGPIDITDSSDEGSSLGRHALHQSMNKTHELSSSNGMKIIGQSEIEDDITHCYQGRPSLLASKRKRASHIVHSDSGSDADDNVPLRRLRKSCSKEASKRAGGAVNRDMDTVTRKSKGKGIPKKYSRGNLKGSESKNNRGIPTTESLTDNETEEGGSDSEGESLNGFIVSGSESDFSIADESSQGEEISNSNQRSASESEDKSEGNVDYEEIMSRIGRRKDHLIKWEFEADMLAAFGKDPELCMQAVCALYRQQTSDEKMSKATIHQNQRGFSHCDATRGSILGEFLTDGDPEGGLKKSLEELLEYQPKGLELCRTLATRYSKQLFAMYQNKEDPLWPALCTNC